MWDMGIGVPFRLSIAQSSNLVYWCSLVKGLVYLVRLGLTFMGALGKPVWERCAKLHWQSAPEVHVYSCANLLISLLLLLPPFTGVGPGLDQQPRRSKYILFRQFIVKIGYLLPKRFGEEDRMILAQSCCPWATRVCAGSVRPLLAEGNILPFLAGKLD